MNNERNERFLYGSVLSPRAVPNNTAFVYFLFSSLSLSILFLFSSLPQLSSWAIDLPN